MMYLDFYCPEIELFVFNFCFGLLNTKEKLSNLSFSTSDVQFNVLFIRGVSTKPFHNFNRTFWSGVSPCAFQNKNLFDNMNKQTALKASTVEAPEDQLNQTRPLVWDFLTSLLAWTQTL